MFSEILSFVNCVASINGIVSVHWNNQKPFNTENVPRYIVEGVRRIYTRRDAHRAIDPFYSRAWAIGSFSVFDRNTTEADMDEINDLIMRQLRIIQINQTFPNIAKYTVDEGSIQVAPIDTIEAKIFDFKITVLQRKIKHGSIKC